MKPGRVNLPFYSGLSINISTILSLHGTLSNLVATQWRCGFLFLKNRLLRSVAYKAGGRGAAAPPLEKFRANSVVRASSSCSKILQDEKYFITVKNFRANSVFQGKRRLFEILNDKKNIFYTVNSVHTLFFRASTSCSKILNVKTIFNSFYWEQAQVPQK